MPGPGSSARVVLGVAGGIAAYKVCELLRAFTEAKHVVRVVPTEAALRFVGVPTWEALSGQPVTPEVWDNVHDVPHVRLGQSADLIVVAPATADLLARAAGGRADDLLTATLLTARCPVLYIPAMHTEMWEHPATQDNVTALRQRGAVVLDPATGRLTGSDIGLGRLSDPDEIFAVAQRILTRGAAGLRLDLTGYHVVVSAGGTREPLDPVRFLGNRSSGRQGYALAGTAVARGAAVTLVTANVALPDPAGAAVIRVDTAAHLQAKLQQAVQDADVVVMAAAVADFRPARYQDTKIIKGDVDPEPIHLVRTPDILAELAQNRPRPRQVVVGFAAETHDALAHGRAKLAAKGTDLLVVNQVGEGQGFDSEDNAAVILAADGSHTAVPLGPKEALADVVWDLAAARLAAHDL